MQEVAIAGIADPHYGIVPGRTQLQLHHEAAAAALEDAGLEPTDVDGLFTADISRELHIVRVAEYLGLRPTFFDGTMTGGGSWETMVEHAAAAIETGRCDVALLTYASTQRSATGSRLGTGARGRGRGPRQFDVVHGAPIVAEYALAAMRHMHEFGTTSEQLAEIAVTTRMHASHNPRALYRDPITVGDVLDSRMIADPLHLLDCCVVTDGCGAIVLTTVERARDLRHAPVRVLGSGSAIDRLSMSQLQDLRDFPAARSGAIAFRQAGLEPSDVDVLQLYDSFTITVLLTLEALGFCDWGESGPFVEEGRLRHDGELPTNTDGGGLSSNHPGMRGIFLLIEAVRQLRGQAALQVPGTEVALCNGTGGALSATGTVILGVDR